MARRNKKVVKLRQYRDRLQERIVDLEAENREHIELFAEIQRALRQEDTLRAFTIASGPYVRESIGLDPEKLNGALAELTLVYNFLLSEREYTEQLDKAVNNRDLLRCAALCAEHKAEIEAHDKQLSRWTLDRGFTRRWRHHDKQLSRWTLDRGFTGRWRHDNGDD